MEGTGRGRRYFRDFYGCSAVMQIHRDGTATLSVSTSHGMPVHCKRHASYQAARAAMRRLSDGWEEEPRLGR